jgi:DNA-binding CsgD family transcriptional regulator
MYERAYNKLREIINSFTEDFSENIIDKESLDKYTNWTFFETNGMAFSIFDFKKAEIIHYSRNFFDILGINKALFAKIGFKAIIRQTAPEHLDYLKHLPKAHLEYLNETKPEFRKNIKLPIVNLRQIHEQKGEIRLCLQNFAIQLDVMNQPEVILGVHHDITHMMKGDYYWFRIYCEDEPDRIVTFHSETKVLSKGDILSKREKEILTLLINGDETDKIAETLSISKNTVNNHRQNMLNRLGAHDITGLITLANICHLV